MNARLVLLAVTAALVLGSAATAAAPSSETPRKEGALATATFAGGCFWSMEYAFDKVPGVVSATSGFMGGTKQNPTYNDVVAGGTGHLEAVQVVYDPGKVSYAQLLDVYWHSVDPLDARGQFCDKGEQYHSAIFFHGPEQQRLAEESKRQLEGSGRFKQPIVTKLLPATAFYAAEEYHQDYAKKNPVRYGSYRTGCRRDARLEALWGSEAPKK